MPDHVVSLAAGVTPELGANPAAFVSSAAKGGWGACGLWFDPGSWTKATTSEVRHRLDGSGLLALDIEVVRLDQPEHAEIGRRLVDAGAQAGARNVLCISRLEDAADTTARFVQLCQLAAAGSLTVCLEFMRFTGVRDLAGAVAIVEAAGQPNGAVLVDTLHLYRSGGSLADLAALARVSPGLLPYAQPCDAPAEPPGWSTAELVTDALDGRCLPGEGGLDVAGFLAALPPGTPLSYEIRSRAVRERWPDPVKRARGVLRGIRESVGI